VPRAHSLVRLAAAALAALAIGNARWKGARLRDVLGLAGGLKPGVRSIVFAGADEFTASLPPDPQLLDDALLVYEMNGQVLPIEHGYPARMLVPNRYGMKGAKWVVNIKPVTSVVVDWYGQRGWSREGIVRTMTRIDTPAEGQKLPPGEHRIAGIAYAGTRGISKVEYSADGGRTWRQARSIEQPDGSDTWLRWEGNFAFEGSRPADLAARAVDGAGQRQSEQVTPVEPDGQAGLDSITVYPA
jgi:DMSO/TMAO reductase YedYZ molybdopterin-dependent catalytic subunit